MARDWRTGRILQRSFIVALAILTACSGDPAVKRLRIPLGAGGVGFLPLIMMREHGLIEKRAAEAGITDLEVSWLDLGGPSVMNDALLSGSVDFIAAGPPAFLTLWDRTRGSLEVKGAAALASLPMYLNARAGLLDSLDDLSEQDKIAVTAIKVSIPAIIMQMVAAERFGADDAFHYDRYTVSMTHPDAVVAMLSGSADIDAHFTSPPFHLRELEDPSIRTILNSNDVMGGTTTFTMLSTTRAFHDANPDVYAAVLAALDDAMTMIRADPAAAADALIAAGDDAGVGRDALIALLRDPEIEFTTTPANTMRYAEFMQSIGSLTERPASWRDLFFSEIHGAAGS